MSSAPTPPNLPAPNLSGANLPQRPSYLDSNMPDPDTIRQQFMQNGGRMPPMPGFQGSQGGDQGSLPPIGADGSWQGNIPPPQLRQMQGGVPISALGVPNFQPGMKPNFQPPSQAQMDNLRALINRSIASRTLTNQGSQT